MYRVTCDVSKPVREVYLSDAGTKGIGPVFGLIDQVIRFGKSIGRRLHGVML
jgi:hypothetical protein